MSSAIALAADVGSFLLLLQMRLPAVPASIAAYTVGLVVHWLLSSRFVFSKQTRTDPAERRWQQLQFIASALVGLVITGLIIKWALEYRIDPRLAKAAAVGVSFQTTYLLRRKLIFS